MFYISNWRFWKLPMQQRYSDASPRLRVEKPTMPSCVAVKFSRFPATRIDITSLYYSLMSDAPPFNRASTGCKVTKIF